MSNYNRELVVAVSIIIIWGFGLPIIGANILLNFQRWLGSGKRFPQIRKRLKKFYLPFKLNMRQVLLSFLANVFFFAGITIPYLIHKEQWSWIPYTITLILLIGGICSYGIFRKYRIQQRIDSQNNIVLPNTK